MDVILSGKHKYGLFLSFGGLLLTSLVLPAQETTSKSRPQSPTPLLDIQATLPGGAKEDADARRLKAKIAARFAKTLAQMQAAPPQDHYHQITLLGKLLLHDKNLSVNKNLACLSCHDPDAGYTGGVSLYNRTTVAYGGSVLITNAGTSGPNVRISARRPQTLSYAAFAPILQYNAAAQDFFGGNFWDMRATGYRMASPTAEQAAVALVDPNVMGFADAAAAVYRVAQSPYKSLFERIWGTQSLAIHWPADMEKLAAVPAPAPGNNPFPVPLEPGDRALVSAAFEHIAVAMAAYQASPDISPFTSKFDFALANPDKKILSREELAGWNLFRGKAKCNSCHLDGTESGPKGKISPQDVTNKAPLFTDFTAVNLGVPKNPGLPFYAENHPDQAGFTANPAGKGYKDLGAGKYLRGSQNVNASWAKLAGQFDGKFRTPTLRNVDARPYRGFVKAYMHNGYLKSLKEVVHFYNTRDKFPRCRVGDAGEKATAWPPPEVSSNKDTTIGDLKLTDREEDQLVAFMRALSDGYFKRDK